MSEIIVRTKEELKEAKEKEYDVIIVEGDLAKDLKKAKAITKLSKTALVTLTALSITAAVAVPVTGGLSLAAAAPIAASVGLTDASVIAVAITIGVVLVVGLFENYEAEFEKSPGGSLKAKFTKKERKK